jgi:chromosome partitioning protein
VKVIANLLEEILQHPSSIRDLRDFYGSRVFKTTIPRNVRLAEAPSFGKPIALYDPKSRGAESYEHLAKEILEHA